MYQRISISPVCGEHAISSVWRARESPWLSLEKFLLCVENTFSPVCGEHDICSKTQGHRGYRVASFDRLHSISRLQCTQFLQCVESTRVTAAIAEEISIVCGEHFLQCVENTTFARRPRVTAVIACTLVLSMSPVCGDDTIASMWRPRESPQLSLEKCLHCVKNTFSSVWRPRESPQLSLEKFL